MFGFISIIESSKNNSKDLAIESSKDNSKDLFIENSKNNSKYFHH